MYVPRHRHFATGLIAHGAHKSEYIACAPSSRFKMCTCAVRNNALMVSCMRVNYFM